MASEQVRRTSCGQGLDKPWGFAVVRVFTINLEFSAFACLSFVGEKRTSHYILY